jgi:predicted RNA methylase
MAWIPHRLVRSAFNFAKTTIRSNKKLFSLLYDLENIDKFQRLTLHEKMLADYTRLDAYAAGIRRAVKPQDVVLDLGCGTGILSMFAAQRSPEKIYAIDHTNIIELAKRIAEHNGITCIDFVQMNSRTFSPDKKVDVIIHEQMGTFLFDENMLENLMDLKGRVLKPNGKIVPSKFELYLEPVCLKREYRCPFIWENNIHGVDFSALKDNDFYKRIAVQTRQRPHSLQSGSLEYYLCKPEPILKIDLNYMDSADDISKSVTCRKTVIRPGAADGISIYFKTRFDEDISFDTALDSPKTSWSPTPLFRIPRRTFKLNDVITLMLRVDNFHDVSTWSITLDGSEVAAFRPLRSD